MMKLNNLPVFVLLVALTACSSVESDIKNFFKCGIAARQLNMSTASRNITMKLERYIKEHSVTGSSRDAMFLGQEVRDDMGLYKKNLEGQIKNLVKIYNSSDCRKLHEQEKIKISDLF